MSASIQMMIETISRLNRWPLTTLADRLGCGLARLKLWSSSGQCNSPSTLSALKVMYRDCFRKEAKWFIHNLEQLGLTDQQIAAQLHVTGPNITKWRTGVHDPTEDHYFALRQLFHDTIVHHPSSLVSRLKTVFEFVDPRSAEPMNIDAAKSTLRTAEITLPERWEPGSGIIITVVLPSFDHPADGYCFIYEKCRPPVGVVIINGSRPEATVETTFYTENEHLFRRFRKPNH